MKRWLQTKRADFDDFPMRFLVASKNRSFKWWIPKRQLYSQPDLLHHTVALVFALPIHPSSAMPSELQLVRVHVGRERESRLEVALHIVSQALHNGIVQLLLPVLLPGSCAQKQNVETIAGTYQRHLRRLLSKRSVQMGSSFGHVWNNCRWTRNKTTIDIHQPQISSPVCLLNTR